MDGQGQGYDIWYYVLQIRSLRAGGDLFSDDSWAFLLLRAATALTGDAVLAVEWVVTAAAVGTAVALAWAGLRLGGLGGGLLAGAVAVASTGHMALSMEFVKNQVGAVPLALSLAAWTERHRWPRAAPVVACLAAVGAAMVHKLAGALALGAAVLMLGSAVAERSRRAALGAAAVAAVAGLAVALVGVVGVGDLDRAFALGSVAERTERLSTLLAGEQLEMVLVHLAPLLALGAWRRGSDRAVVWGMGALAVVCAAPGMPFDFDGVAWRLLCMGFVPLALLGAAARPSMPVAALVAAGALMVGVSTTRARPARGPDYAAWHTALPTLRAAVPPGHRLVAHRGVCGFLWAEGGHRCENFEPSGDLTTVHRVVYGFSEAALAPYGPSRSLLPGYRLMAEPDWQTLRGEAGDRFPLATDPRNPYRPRPAYVKVAAP